MKQNEITVRRQASKIYESDSHLTFLFQGDVFLVAGDKQARRIIHSEKRKNAIPVYRRIHTRVIKVILEKKPEFENQTFTG